MSNWLKATAASLVAVFTPVHAIMLTVGFLIVFDLITGVWAAKVRKEKISSAAFRRTATKLAIYQIVIMTGFLTEIHLIDGLFPVSKIAASIIGLTELLSILENSEVIHGEPIFKKLINKLGSDNDKKKH
jgi:phage-related holin